ncbi:hypothetical protein C9I28_22250 [Pseudoduganella armeniaca]|uniref:Uncharacterized protein n=2 Tax=Pseudoduganella armeniaca TaxID=2072590 RepID=A0A2R4CEI6_9BURK|nr:hypothetical protein C9I28_22250 [Pseudoduganella armeniaca]
MTVQEQQAFVICKDVALVQHVWTFVEQGWRRMSEQGPSPSEIALAIRTELTHARDQLRQSRQMLENIRIRSSADGLLLVPATWVRDLDGDGDISIAERHFFAIPVRNDSRLAVRPPSDEREYYEQEYSLKAAVRTDQSDILWSLSYHYFAEALMEMALSYQYQERARANPEIFLAHPEGMRRAHQLLVRGIETSERMRQSVLAERDDDLEWLANPRQANTAFPVPLDDDDFRVWGELMHHLIPLVRGRTVLPLGEKMSGSLAALARVCPEGQGFSVPALFADAPKYPLASLRREAWSKYCRKIDASHPASGLHAFVQSYADKPDQTDSAAMRYLRRFLWVN